MDGAVSIRFLEPTETFFCLTVLQSTPSRARGMVLNHTVWRHFCGERNSAILFYCFWRLSMGEAPPPLDAQQHCLETHRHLPGGSWGAGRVDSWVGAHRFSEALTEETPVCISCWAPEGRAKAAAAILLGKGEFGPPCLLRRKPQRPLLPSRSSLGLLCVSAQRSWPQASATEQDEALREGNSVPAGVWPGDGAFTAASLLSQGTHTLS